MARTRADRDAERRARSGSGPTGEQPPPRWPGATSAFGLFGEVMLVGILTTLVGLLVLTLPAALAAGTRHLRRYLAAEDSSMDLYWRDVRRALPGSLLVGAAATALAALLVVDVALGRAEVLPAGQLVAAVGYFGLALLAAALFAASAAWTPETGWRVAVRAMPRVLAADPVGVLYLGVTAVFAVIVTWQLLPLIIPALGCVVLAIVAVPERPRRVSRAR